METKGITCKIPLQLHDRISGEIRETESTMSKFIEMIINEHYQRGEQKIMEKGRTLAFQVSEELFGKIKEYLERYEKTYRRRLTQREFVIGLIEQALEEAEEEFEAARAAEYEARTEETEDTEENTNE
ncbi:translation initiation factor 2 [Massiliimalia timonensis]|uniref:translation initiation factor 2 n=1 Tax=Massiliimalia timonensis TaxID=1987501 RepID=UPI001939CC83|nr:translation initiation factor 2 [Massiliimalia timonensis]